MLRAVEDRDNDSFPGLCVMYPALPNGHKVKILYKESQLNEVIYPDLVRALQEGGFQAVEDWWDLLITVAVGGTMSLNGPRYPNPECYQPATIQDVFMRAERTLAHAPMTAVFCKQVPYGCSPISFKEVNGSFKFDTNTAFRRATHVFLAETGSEKDLYRITIEGAGNDLSKHRFTFEPSLTWLCSRYPEKFRLSASTGEALDRDSEGPPEQLAVVSSKPEATRGGGCDRDLSTASEPLVRDL